MKNFKTHKFKTHKFISIKRNNEYSREIKHGNLTTILKALNQQQNQKKRRKKNSVRSFYSRHVNMNTLVFIEN